MRHRKHTFKVGRTAAHRGSMLVNMMKSLIENGRICTTVTKAKELRRHADKIITIAKNKNDVAGKRQAASVLRIKYNTLPAGVKATDTSYYNRDRTIIGKLFGELRENFKDRNGGYTRITRAGDRVGDSAPTCYIEYVVDKK